jgi:hypothetical protein
MTGLSYSSDISWSSICALALVSFLRSCSPSRLTQGATAFVLSALILALAPGHNYGPLYQFISPALPFSFTSYRPVTYSSEGARCLVHVASLP